MFVSPWPQDTRGFVVPTFCLLQYVFPQLITETTRFKYVTQQSFFTPALIKLHLPPCCSLCTPSIHPSIPFASVLLHTVLIWPLTYSSFQHFVFPPICPTYKLIFSPCQIQTLISPLLSFCHPSTCSSFFLYHSYFHPAPRLLSASLRWQVLWEQDRPCQCQAIPQQC